MKISTRTFSDRGNESLLALGEGLNASERLLPSHLLFGGTLLLDLGHLLQRFHLSPPRRLSPRRRRRASTFRLGVPTCCRPRRLPLRPLPRRAARGLGGGGCCGR